MISFLDFLTLLLSEVRGERLESIPVITYDDSTTIQKFSAVS